MSGNICAFPGCSLPLVDGTGTIAGEICHIKARSCSGPRFDPAQSEEERHGFANLILLCRQHHKVIDDQSGIYTADVLQEMKAIHEGIAGRPEQKTDVFYAKILLNAAQQVEITNNSGNIAINSPGTVQAQTITIKTNQKKVSITPPQGTIGADIDMGRYVEYLIKRYNEFAAKDSSRPTRFAYGAIYKNVETQFGGHWKLVPTSMFAAVCLYLQKRISKTRLAKQNASNGYPAFSTYEEFLTKHATRL
mgnify:CR=1 FL=1